MILSILLALSINVGAQVAPSSGTIDTQRIDQIDVFLSSLLYGRPTITSYITTLGSWTFLSNGAGIKWADGTVSTSAFSATSSAVTVSTPITGNGTITFPLSLASSSVTLQGNSFNAASQLLQLDSSGLITQGMIPLLSIDTTRLGIAAVDTTKIVNGAIQTSKLSPASVDTTKLAPDAVTSQSILAGSINTAKVATDAIDSTKILSDAKTLYKVSGGSMSIAGGNVAIAANASQAAGFSTTLDSATVSNNFYAGSVSAGVGIGGCGSSSGAMSVCVHNGSEISFVNAAGSVVDLKAQLTDHSTRAPLEIAASTINFLTTTGNGNYSLTTSTGISISAGGVHAPFFEGNLNGVNLVAGTVDTTRLSPGSVDTGKLVNGAVDTNKISAAAINTFKIAPSGVAAATYGSASNVPVFTVAADGRITGASIVAVSATVAAGSIDTSKLAPGAVDTTKLVNGAVDTNKLNPASVDTSKLAPTGVGAKTCGSATTSCALDVSVDGRVRGTSDIAITFSGPALASTQTWTGANYQAGTTSLAATPGTFFEGNKNDGLMINLSGPSFFAKSIDGATQSSGCIVAINMNGSSPGATAQFTSTTTASFNLSTVGVFMGVLLEKCTPGQFCHVGRNWVYYVFGTNLSQLIGSSFLPAFSTTRCKAVADNSGSMFVSTCRYANGTTAADGGFWMACGL